MASFITERSSSEDLADKLSLLQKAIQYGDVQKATDIVSLLAKVKADLAIQEKNELSPKLDTEMSVKVFVEDKDLSGSHMWLKLKPSTKIGDLKRKMLIENGFPLEIQKWIVGKKIVRDEDSLHRLRVKSGSSVFLYLLSPQSIGSTREDVRKQQNAQSSNDEMSRRLSSTTSVSTPSDVFNNSLSNRTSLMSSQIVEDERLVEEQEDDYLVPVNNRPTTTNPPLPDVLHYAEVGWECPQCTFRNEPTRPGCEMCSADRPADYQMPEGISYEITDKERRRLAREREAEEQANEHDQHELINQQLDTLLAHPIQDEIQRDRFRFRLEDYDRVVPAIDSEKTNVEETVINNTDI